MPRYPFSPAVLDALPEELAELFRALELKLLEEICSRLKVAGQLNEVTVQDIRALRAHGIDLGDIQRAIAQTTGTGMDELEALLDDVVARNQAYYTSLIDLAQVTAPETLLGHEDIWAIYEQTRGQYRNITRSMGFLVRQGGRLTMLEPARAYQWALDQAALQVQSGAVSYGQAISEAVRQLADSGLRTVNYDSGHVDSVDVAVRRAVMTGINQLNQRYREQSMDYLETDLVEVTAHLGARNVDGPNGWENHAAWQGKVYRWTEKPKASRGRYPDFEQTCGYGSVTGIGGANCRHSFWPFIEGVSERTYTDEELEGMKPEDRPKTVFDGREYDDYQATQMQRRIERTIRKQKRRKAAYEAAGLTEDAQAANIRLRRLNEKYHQFSRAAGLPEQRERLKVLDGRSSLAAAPQEKLTRPGDVFEPKTAINSLLKRLENLHGMQDNIDVIRYYTENTDFVLDHGFDGPIAYDRIDDVIRYNPDWPLPDGVDIDGVLIHELSHRADILMYRTFSNPVWQEALKQTESILVGQRLEIEAWFIPGGKYADDAFLSDIVSAIFRGKIDVPYSHSAKYWAMSETREKEIFANLSVITMLNTSGAEELSGAMKFLYDAFLKIC